MKAMSAILVRHLGLCALILMPLHASADLAEFDTPQLVLSDAEGLPFYPMRTHIFPDVTLDAEAFRMASPQPAARTPSSERTATSARVVSRRTSAASSPVLPSRITQEAISGADIMDSWSVGVFR